MSTRLKLNLDPPIYSIDSPGVMIPFLGYGERAKERGLKLALICKALLNNIQYLEEGLIDFAAGIKEDLYDYQDLTAYLLYRLISINPYCTFSLRLLLKTIVLTVVFLSRFPLFVALAFSAHSEAPPFPGILQRPPRPPNYPPTDFLDDLALRLKAMLPGGIPDRQRASRWFVEWWREALLKSPSCGAMGKPEWGWTFDCIWQDDFHGAPDPTSAFSNPHAADADMVLARSGDHGPSDILSKPSFIPEPASPGLVRSRSARLDEEFDRILADYAKQIRDREVIESQTQAKKRMRLEEERKREAKRRTRAAAKYGGRRT